MTMTSSDRPQRARRSFSTQEKADWVRRYDETPHGGKGAFLRENNLYFSNIRAWREEPGKAAKKKVRAERDRVSELEAENADLRGKLAASDRTVSTLGKAFELLENVSKSTRNPR